MIYNFVYRCSLIYIFVPSFFCGLAKVFIDLHYCFKLCSLFVDFRRLRIIKGAHPYIKFIFYIFMFRYSFKLSDSEFDDAFNQSCIHLPVGQEASKPSRPGHSIFIDFASPPDPLFSFILNHPNVRGARRQRRQPLNTYTCTCTYTYTYTYMYICMYIRIYVYILINILLICLYMNRS